jgi:hypothetical protein
MKKRRVVKIGKNRKNQRNYSTKNNSSKKILILFSIVVMMLIIIMIIAFFNELFNNNYNKEIKSAVYDSYKGNLGSSGIFKINNAQPNGSVVSFFLGEDKTFSISNNNYQRIEWYLDEENIKNDTPAVDFTPKSAGNHTLMVKIINGSQIDSRVWEIVVYNDEKQIKFVFDSGPIMFAILLIILFIIMGLILWLLIGEHRKRKKMLKLELGIVGEEISPPGFVRKRDMSNRFNIPRN